MKKYNKNIKNKIGIEKKEKEFGKEFWKPGNMLYPLPAVMVSCADKEKTNIITIAWTGTVCTNPDRKSVV